MVFGIILMEVFTIDLILIAVIFRQFAFSRFIISFIVFILSFVVAKTSYDGFFQLLIAGMFFLTLYIMHEMRKGHADDLLKKEQEGEEKYNELKEVLIQKELENRALLDYINKNTPTQ